MRIFFQDTVYWKKFNQLTADQTSQVYINVVQSVENVPVTLIQGEQLISLS